MCVILSDWKLFVKLLLYIVVPHEASAEESAEHAFVNTMIMARSLEKRVNRTGDRISTVALAPLKAAEKRAVTVQAYNYLIDVFNYLFLSDLGCIYLCTEWYLSTGANTQLPKEWLNEEHPRLSCLQGQFYLQHAANYLRGGR